MLFHTEDDFLTLLCAEGVQVEVLLPNGLFLVVEEGCRAKVNEGLLQVLLVELVFVSEVIVILLHLVGGVILLFEFLL